MQHVWVCGMVQPSKYESMTVGKNIVTFISSFIDCTPSYHVLHK